jgi:O-antigen ligase
MLKTINSFYLSYLSSFLINYITILIYPAGMYFNGMYYTNWFLLYDNVHIFMFLPTIALLYIASCYDNRSFKILTAVAIYAITFSVFYCFSLNSVATYTALLIYWTFENKLSKVKLLNVTTYFVTYLLADLLIVKFRIQYLFAGILNFFNKGVTLNNRTILWDMVSSGVAESPWIGHGMLSQGGFAKVFKVKNYTHAHNTLLDILYKGGFLLLICFLLIVFCALYELNKCKHKVSRFLSFILWIMFFMMIFEAREEKIGLYIVLVLAYNVKYIVKSIEIN